MVESTDKTILKERRIPAKRVGQVLLILLSVGFVCYGVSRGEADTVFTKAIRLCLECVGIG